MRVDLFSLRFNAGLSYEELAELLNHSKEFILEIEWGIKKPTLALERKWYRVCKKRIPNKYKRK